jgi:hypothetical protein
LDADIQKLLCYQNFHFGGLSFLVAAKTTQWICVTSFSTSKSVIFG